MTLRKEKLKMLVVVTVMIMLNIPSIRSSQDLSLQYYSLPLLLVLITILLYTIQNALRIANEVGVHILTLQ